MNPGSNQRFSIKRWIAKFYLDRSIDTGRAPPAWVTDLCQRDATLAEYERRGRSLVNQLRKQADTWAADQSKLGPSRAAATNATPAHAPGTFSRADRPAEQLASRPRAWRLLATAALLLLAIGIYITWRQLAASDNEPQLVQQSESDAMDPNQDGVGDGRSERRIAPDQRDDRNKDPMVAWKPVLASAAATEEVFRRVSNGTRHLLSRTLASTTEFSVDAPLARIEEAGKGLRESGTKLRESLSGFSNAFSQRNAAEKQPQ